MKKLLTAGLVLLSVATLAACGNKSSDSASKVSSTTEQTSASSKTDNSKTNASEVTLLTDEEIDNAKTIGDMKTLFGKLIDNYKKYVEEIGDKVPEAQKDAYKQQVEPALNSLETSRKAFNDGLSSAGSDDTEMPEEARTVFLQQLKTARDAMKQAIESASKIVSAQ